MNSYRNITFRTKIKKYFVYILSNKIKTFICRYDRCLIKKTFEHKEGLIEGFTKKHNVNKLVYYEVHPDFNSAVKREKQLKKLA